MRSLRFPRPLFVALGCAALLTTHEARPAGGTEATPPQPATLLDHLGPIPSLLQHARWDAARGAYFARLADGREAELTLDHDLQSSLTRALAQYGALDSAVVALDPKTGRILAMAQASNGSPTEGLATEAVYPAASIFKIVTGAALLESGIAPDTRVCFHGGLRGFGPKLLRDNPRLDWHCASMATGLALSLNLVFGKLARRDLTAKILRAMAGRFLFNEPLPVFPSADSVGDALVSQAIIPADALGFPRTAAGFGKVYLSPLHGALLAAIVGNGGVAVEPRLVDAVVDNGRRVSAPGPTSQRVISESTSAVLTAMMERTVSMGTAHRAFRGRRLRRLLGPIHIAGKTGSLADHPPKPFKDYSWFVGFAPADDPTVAIAAVVVNGRFWKVHAPEVARDAFQTYFEDQRDKSRHASR